MKRPFQFVLTLILMITCMFTNLAFAQAESDLTNLLKKLHTMQANFTQSIEDNKGKKIQEVYGHMALQRPGKFRWQVKKPIPQLIIANGSRLWIYDPDLEQVTIRSLSHAAGETPALLLSHENTMINQDYVVQEEKKNAPGWRWFLLKPKKADNMFLSIEMGFKGEQITEMHLADHLGHTTIVKFSNIVSNKKLPDVFFVFKPKPNVDVIDESKK